MNSNRQTISTNVLLRLFPIVFAIHFAEEYWCGEGYTAYLLRLRGVEFSATRFIAFQTMGLVLFIAAGFLARRLRFTEFMACMLGGLVLCNGLSHSLTALWDGHYGPGLFSSVFLWIPLGIVTLIVMFRRFNHKEFTIATLIGFAINGMIAVVTMRGGRLL
jgi:uncharacterized membrane protein HdeD (DUF308 family)